MSEQLPAVPVEDEEAARETQELLDAERPEAWIAEREGDRIVGELVRYEDAVGPYGPELVVILRTPDGTERALWLFGPVLRGQFGKLRPEPGEWVGVRYEGERKNAGGVRYKVWRVVVRRTDAARLPDFASLAEEVEDERTGALSGPSLEEEGPAREPAGPVGSKPPAPPHHPVRDCRHTDEQGRSTWGPAPKAGWLMCSLCLAALPRREVEAGA